MSYVPYAPNRKCIICMRLFQLYRHGDRTPVTTFPLDPVKPDEWPNGYLILLRRHSFHLNSFSFGQLTKAGIEQQHRLGAYIRHRY